MDDKEITPHVPADEPEEENERDAPLEEEPAPVLIVDTEGEAPVDQALDEEAEPAFDADLEPDTRAVLFGGTYDLGEPDAKEAGPPPFLEADRDEELEWEAPPLGEEALPQPHDLTAQMEAEEGMPDLGPEPGIETAPPEPEVEPVITQPATPPPPPARPPARDTAPRRGGVGWGGVLAIGLLSALVGAALALLVLFALNGSLIYPRNRDRAQDQEISHLGEQLSGVETRLGMVDRRVGEVDTLNTRVGEVEGQVETLGGDLDTLQGDVSAALDEVDAVQGNLEAVATRTAGIDEDVTALSEEVTDMDDQIGVLEEIARRFDLFLAGLRDLLDQSEVAPEDQALTPTPTPFAARATVTPLPTVTPGANVTVIPLATPTPVN